MATFELTTCQASAGIRALDRELKFWRDLLAEQEITHDRPNFDHVGARLIIEDIEGALRILSSR